MIPSGVLATAANRVVVEDRAETSAVSVTAARLNLGGFSAVATVAAEAIAVNVRQAALDAVDGDLVKEKLLTAVGGTVSPAAQKLLGWERQIALPTAGVIVKGCLDDCDVCEPSLDREIELELERRQLENELLKKQIALLEKSQEYRCCPVDEDEGTVPAP